VSTAPRTEPRATRTVRIRGRRMVAAVAVVAATPLTLAACGVLGGGTNHGDAPVEISQDDGGDQAASSGVDPGTAGGAVTATQPTTQLITSGGVTVTRVGLRTLVNTQIRTQVNTKVNTQIKTQQLTKTAVSTRPAVTDFQTVNNTVTRTVTDTITRTVPPAAP
jgi:hypothetical protein